MAKNFKSYFSRCIKGGLIKRTVMDDHDYESKDLLNADAVYSHCLTMVNS